MVMVEARNNASVFANIQAQDYLIIVVDIFIQTYGFSLQG
jgi:hypothetical protein